MPWVLVLSDGKPGHENQSAGVVPDGVGIRSFRVEYRSKASRYRAWAAARVAMLSSLLAGAFPWGGLIRHADRLAGLAAEMPDAILSTGSGPAPVNLLLARRLNRPAITCMTPSVGLSGFQLALVPRHDHPPQSDHIVTTIGAPNLVDSARLVEQGQAFRQRHNLPDGPFVVLLMGGDAAHFAIGPDTGVAILRGALALARELGMRLLVTTSRRTPEQTEAAMATVAESAPECAYFCRGRTDPERVVPGMLALAALALVTEDSVSMVSEAASSNARVVAVAVERKGGTPPRRHEAVLSTLARDGYVARADAEHLAAVGAEWMASPPPPMLDDSARCQQAVARLMGLPRPVPGEAP